MAGAACKRRNRSSRLRFITVHPPEGRVRIAAPERMELDIIRLYAISKLPWIRRQQATLRAQQRETLRQYRDRESHEVRGTRYLLKVVERVGAPKVELRQRTLLMSVRPGTSSEQRHALMAQWQRAQLRETAEPMMAKWSRALKVDAEQLFVRTMKTKWGSCNHLARTIRLNTELVKKPLRCLDYVVLHECAHLLEPTHGQRFRALLDRYLPQWSHVRDELNHAPLGYVQWKC